MIGGHFIKWWSRTQNHITLSSADKSSLKWWAHLLANWNGVSLFNFPKFAAPMDVQLASDAAGKHGLGIVYGRCWVSEPWPVDAPSNIAILEMIPIVLAAELWGSSWEGFSAGWLL